MTDIAEGADPAADFAALMSKAAESADAEAAEAPYGRKPDGTPKRSNGGRRKSPSLDELKAGQPPETGGESPEVSADRAPETPKRGRGRAAGAKKDAPVPQFREGQIAKGVNRLYRKAGKIVRAMDPEVGNAIIEATKKEDDDDITVGEAWEELARTNVRIRRFLLKMIAGGAWGQLFMAHAPILLAVIMKDSVRRFIPFMKIIESMAEPDDDSAPGEGGLPGGMTAGDVAEASRLAQAQMAKMGFEVSPDIARAAERMFGGAAGGDGATGSPPPAFTRNQPRKQTRAQRAGHR